MINRMLIVILGLLVTFGLACSSTDFGGRTGIAANAKGDGKDGDDDDDGDDDGNDNGDGDLVPDADGGDDKAEGHDEDLGGSDDEAGADDLQTSEDDVDCAKDPVKDAAEAFAFNSNDEIRAFVNEKCEVQIPTAWKTQGCLRDDAATQEMICKLKGFKKANSFTTKSWSSPGDNHMSWWEAGEKRFKLVSSSSGQNHYLGTLVCGERLHTKCSKEAEKVKCAY